MATPLGKIAVGPRLGGMVKAVPSKRRYVAGSIARPDQPWMALGSKKVVQALARCVFGGREYL
jgi:hypothetical protein